MGREFREIVRSIMGSFSCIVFSLIFANTFLVHITVASANGEGGVSSYPPPKINNRSSAAGGGGKGGAASLACGSARRSFFQSSKYR